MGACPLKSTPLGPTFKDAAGVIQTQAAVRQAAARHLVDTMNGVLTGVEDLSRRIPYRKNEKHTRKPASTRKGRE